MRGTTFNAGIGFRKFFISIHVPRAGYDYLTEIADAIRAISIHVPRAGYDAILMGEVRLLVYFYPRTPCGVRPSSSHSARSLLLFLSTYPVRGTTRACRKEVVHSAYFYPRTPCGVRLVPLPL